MDIELNDDPDVEINTTQKYTARKWQSHPSFAPNDYRLIGNAADCSNFHAMRSGVNNPYDGFCIFCDDQFIDGLVEQSNIYASQHNNHLAVTADEMKTFIAILLR